jgi:hypothetical protein
MNIANNDRTGWGQKNVHSDQTTSTENSARITAATRNTHGRNKHNQYHSEIKGKYISCE